MSLEREDGCLPAGAGAEDVTTELGTHRVFNVPPPLEEYDSFALDHAFAEAAVREGGEWGVPLLAHLGQRVGSREVIEWGHLANVHVPELRAFDRHGRRIDEVVFHPSWHQLMQLGMAAGVHNLSWLEARRGAHVVRAGLLYLLGQAEAGVTCPLTMTHAVVPALRMQPELFAEWEPHLRSSDHDPRFLPAAQKRSALFGMAMTEKQGGSDVRANTTRARPLGPGGPGGAYELTGHKWFCSAPMCDAFLTLARTGPGDGGGLSCFLVPRWRPDGSRNRFRIQRLKNKLGNRSNASSEIEYERTWARMVGLEGRGVATIIAMVHHTRIDIAVGAAAGMRLGVMHAAHHATQRSAFGRRLIDQPAMRNVLADLHLEAEAALALAMRVAATCDATGEADRLLGRILTPVAKYWNSKRAAPHAAEALECLGGNGYVEESLLPRLYREAPLGSIWEGSGNVQCLDALRAMHREPGTVEALHQELALARGADRRLDAFLTTLEDELRSGEELELRARRLVERMALAAQAALLVRHAPPAVADAFCASRLTGERGGAHGTLPPGCDFAAILARAWPT